MVRAAVWLSMLVMANMPFAAGPQLHPVSRPLRAAGAMPVAHRAQCFAEEHEGRLLRVRKTLPGFALLFECGGVGNGDVATELVRPARQCPD